MNSPVHSDRRVPSLRNQTSFRGTKREVFTGNPPNEFELPQGQHSFRVAVDSQGSQTVSNPNFGIILDVVENEATPTATPTATAEPESPNVERRCPP